MKAKAIFKIGLAASILVGLGVGYVLNIISIAQTTIDTLTGLFVLRCIGIVAAPFGALLGYF